MVMLSSLHASSKGVHLASARRRPPAGNGGQSGQGPQGTPAQKSAFRRCVGVDVCEKEEEEETWRGRRVFMDPWGAWTLWKKRLEAAEQRCFRWEEGTKA